MRYADQIPMKKIVFTSGKGGVGKSTIAAAYGKILQKYGKGLLNFTGGIYPGGANGWFKIYEGTLKLNAQDIAPNANLTAKIQF